MAKGNGTKSKGKHSKEEEKVRRRSSFEGDDSDERVPLGVRIGIGAATVAIGGVLAIVSAGTMNGMKSNAVDRVRATIMAGAATDEALGEGAGVDGTGHGGTVAGGGSATDGVGGAEDGAGEGGATDGKGKDAGKDAGSGDGGAGDGSIDTGVSQAPCATGTGMRVHDVAPGETLSDISRRYGVSVDDIAAANGIRNPNLIYAGSSLVIPEK
jgi:LysM repeat protein